MSQYKAWSKADLAAGIAQCELWSPHTVPLLQAAFHDTVSLAFPGRDAPPPLKMLARSSKPAIVVIGDDRADGSDTGPSGWPNIRKLTRWAKRAVIHGTGGRVEHYRAVVLLAKAERRLVLVETGTEYLQAWHQLFARAGVATLNLVPSDGGVHPVPTPRSELQ